MKINEIKIKTNSKNYSIIIGRNLIGKIDKILTKSKIDFEKCLIVADKNIPNRFKKVLYKKLRKKNYSKSKFYHLKI